jgi:RNA polymerase sigma-70 factor, ECF subfamily
MRNELLKAREDTLADDAALARRIGLRDQAAFESLMRRYNGRLFRVARAILKDDAEAEDVLQDAYLDAYKNIGQFRGDSQLATWLVRIVSNRALMRLRKQKREQIVVSMDRSTDGEGGVLQFPDRSSESPTAAALRAEARRLLERRIDELPLSFRTVFVLREIEELSVEEVSACLGIPPATVRTRLFRARALLREALARDLDHATGDVFAFAGDRCDRIVTAVLKRVAAEDTGTPLPSSASNTRSHT